MYRNSDEPLDDTVQLSDLPLSMLSDISDEMQQNEDLDTASMIPDVSVASSNYNNITDVVANTDGTPRPRTSKRRSYLTVAVLVFINLLNYMDRFTVAGVLLKVQAFFHIDNQMAGLIQTSFIVSYMLLSPIFGYLGDRYNRKIIMTVGIAFWSAITLASSFVPANLFGLFLFLRGCVGIGEASYSTIAPTIIADLFAKDQRTKMLAIFYFAIPIGSGLGYIVGSNVADAFNQWQWALRVTPIMGAVCLILIVFLTTDPPRGESEGGTQLHATSYINDLKDLLKTPSFVWSTLGFTCVAFVTGALALWAPAFIDYSLRATGHYKEFSLPSYWAIIFGGICVNYTTGALTWWTPTALQYSVHARGEHMELSYISLIFGIITCAAGFIGVGAGAEIARRYKKINPRADPLICAFGLLTCAPFLYVALIVAEYSFMATCIVVFIGETLLCLNWALVADILLYCVIPTRRSTAEAFQILISHLLGDAGSPYLIGLISDALRGDRDATLPSVQFQTFQYALYSTVFVCILGGGGFLACALYIEEDKKRADTIIKESQVIISDTDSDDDMLNADPDVEDAKHSFRRTQLT